MMGIRACWTCPRISVIGQRIASCATHRFFATARAGLDTVIWGGGSINVAPEVAREEAVPLAA